MYNLSIFDLRPYQDPSHGSQNLFHGQGMWLIVKNRNFIVWPQQTFKRGFMCFSYREKLRATKDLG